MPGKIGINLEKLRLLSALANDSSTGQVLFAFSFRNDSRHVNLRVCCNRHAEDFRRKFENGENLANLRSCTQTNNERSLSLPVIIFIRQDNCQVSSLLYIVRFIITLLLLFFPFYLFPSFLPPFFLPFSYFYISCNLFVLINLHRDRTTRLRTIRYSHAHYTMQISI